MEPMAEHRVSMLGSSLRRFEDPARSTDPRIRAVVAGLRTLEVAPPARAHFRAELRAQLVAVAPRLIADGTAIETPASVAVLERPRPVPRPRTAVAAARPNGVRRVLDRLANLPINRPLGVMTAVIAVLGLLLGGAVLMSRHALPGDTLYGLKRASENVELGLASGPTDRANLLLGFAHTRADEVNALLARADSTALSAGPNASGGLSARTASLIKSTLASADEDVTQASQLLGTAAVRSKSTKPLDIMAAWTPGQTARLTSALQRIPAGQLHAQAALSVSLVNAAHMRAVTLMPQVDCGCLGNAATDNLGPVPLAVLPSLTNPSTSPAPNGPSTGSSSGSNSGGNPGTGNGASSTGVTSPTSGGGSSSSTPPLIPLPSIPLPSLPLPSLSSPIDINSCGITASLGPINIGIGPCGVHLGH